MELFILTEMKEMEAIVVYRNLLAGRILEYTQLKNPFIGVVCLRLFGNDVLD